MTAGLTTTCGACGKTVPEGNFCASCGAPLKSPQFSAPSAEQRHLTVLFCDLAGSVALSESLGPETYHEVLRDYQSICTAAVETFDGYVAQYLGDGVLVYFGYPVAHEDDARRSVLAGLSILDAVATRNEGAVAASRTQIAVRIGIHTGYAIAGEVGSGSSREDLALGQAPNIAARLQAIAVPGTAVITDTVLRLVEGFFSVEALGPQSLKGLQKEVLAYRVIGPTDHTRFEAAMARGLTPFVGRKEEKEVLEAMWRATKNGASTWVLVRGEAGIGKSRLTRHIAAMARSDSNVAQCDCSPYHTNSVLYPIIDLLRRDVLRLCSDLETPCDALGQLEAFLKERRIDLEASVPLLASLLDLPCGDCYLPPRMSGERKRDETLGLLVQLIERARKPQLMIFEDLQWADATTLEFVRRLIEDTQQPSLMMLMTGRPEFNPVWGKSVRKIELCRFGGAEVDQLISRVATNRMLPREVSNLIAAAADGVPLFVEELTKAVLESGALVDRGDRFEVQGSLPAHLVPESLHDSLVARLDRLGPAKEIAQHASVIGRRFQYSLLARIVNLAEKDLHRGLQQLIGAGLVFVQGVPPNSHYLFKHALVQVAAYESLLKRARRDLHGRIVEILQQEVPEVVETQPELAAFHATRAGRYEPAIGYWSAAGQRAFARSANVEAAGHLKAGLDLLIHIGDEGTRHRQELEILSILGPALIATTGYASEEVGAVYERARVLCDALPGNPKTFQALRGSWVFFLVRGELSRSRRFAEEMLDQGEAVGDSSLLIVANWALGPCLFYQGETAAARRHLESAIALYEPERHRSHALIFGHDPAVCAHCFKIYVDFFQGRFQDAEESLRRAAAHAEALKHPVTTSWSLAFRCLHHMLRHEPEEARAAADVVVRHCKEQQVAFWLQVAIIVRGWGRAAMGELEAGITEMREGIAAYTGIGGGAGVPVWYTLLGEALLDAGRLKEAAQALEEGFRYAERNGERISDIELWRVRGKLRETESPQEIEPALECYREALAAADRCEARGAALRVATALHRMLAEREPSLLGESRLGDLVDEFPADLMVPDLVEARQILQGSTHERS